MPSLTGAVIGILSILTIYVLYKHADEFSNGNIEKITDMITKEDIDRCIEEKQGLKLVVVDTGQFFKFEIPADQDAEAFINSAECRAECAARILNQTTDLIIDRECTRYDETNGYWMDP